jgi:hypothetical protein
MKFASNVGVEDLEKYFCYYGIQESTQGSSNLIEENEKNMLLCFLKQI